MQASSRSGNDATNRTLSAAGDGALPRRTLRWYVAFALLTTLTETLFLLSSLPFMLASQT